jgi:hypothetical protein
MAPQYLPRLGVRRDEEYAGGGLMLELHLEIDVTAIGLAILAI